MQNFEAMALVLGCIGTLCWIVCFCWMHRISFRQDAMLEELHEMTRRIEKLSQAEHDLMSDVHPQVSEIKEHVENVREVVSSERANRVSI
jgi:DNA replication initiation complex subunit (GINS family)